VVVIILLLLGFFILLKILKQKGYANTEIDDLGKMKIIDKFYVDSKNKIIKIKDGENIITLLVGSGSVISTEKIKKEKVKNESSK